jgi:glutamate synthase domain-containing protein 1
MCGIAGLIWKGGVTSDIGSEMTQMLQALKHRGPDSTGFALYGKSDEDVHILRFKVAEQEEMKTGFDIHRQVVERKAAVDGRLEELGAEIIKKEDATEYAFRYLFKFNGDL